MPPLRSDVFQQLIEGTPEDAAATLIAAHHGDRSAAERDVWDTWSFLVGGEPCRRDPKAVDEPEARFCMAIVRAMEDVRFAKRAVA